MMLLSQIEERLKQLEARSGKNDETVRALRENFDVIAHMEGRQSTMLKDHSEWLVAHDKAMTRLDKLAVESRDADRHLEKQIGDLVAAIGEFIRREKT